MKITKLAVFSLTFLIGSFSVWLIKPISPSKNETKIESQQLQVAQFESKTEILQLPIFNVEEFWNEPENQHNKRLLETGEVTNTKDIKAKSGETWFGLFSENSKEFLRSTKIKIGSKKEFGFSWKKVSVKEKTKPLFLLKKSKPLKEGKVTTLWREKTQNEVEEWNESATIRENFTKKFILGEREYTLHTVKGLSEKHEPILVLMLETENTSQIIHIIYFEEGNYVGNLYWAGDLDNDGKLDLFMDFYGYEKGYYNSGLFLSSEAERGKLVKKLEYFALSTC